MRLILGLNDRYCRTPDGAVWTDEATWSYALLRRYLSAFESVVAAARVRAVNAVCETAIRADGPGVEFADVPYFDGPLDYAKKWFEIRWSLRRLVRHGDAVILRLPAWHVSSMLFRQRPGPNYPYGVEVCGDSVTQLAGGAAARNWYRPLGWMVARTSRRICRGACAALYVTRRQLQAAYPPAGGAFSIGDCSNVELPPEAFCEKPRCYNASRALRVLFVGSLATPIKGADVLIDAVSLCRAGGMRVELTVVGDGRELPALRRQAMRAGPAHNVNFTGRLPAGDAVREQFDRADLFVVPSRSEGLPRALIEAMARGLPCVGTRAGGIPELLGDDVLVSVGSSHELSDKITELWREPDRMLGLAWSNLRAARRYSSSELAARRREFFAALRSRTAAWLEGQSASGQRQCPTDSHAKVA